MMTMIAKMYIFLIMTATLAKIAKVPRVVVCSPPNSKGTINPLTLTAAKICQVDEFYKIDESAQQITRDYRLENPGDNLMSQSIRIHQLTLKLPN